MNQSVAEERISAEQTRGGTFDYANLALGRLLSAIGVNLGQYQPTFVQRRVARRMRQCGLDRVDDDYVHLVRNPAETRQLGYALQRPSGSPFRAPSALFELDLICCRNLLGYLELAVQRSVLEFMHAALRSCGCLLLDDADALPGRRNLFEADAAQGRATSWGKPFESLLP